MDSKDLSRKTAHLNALLEQKLGLRKGTLGHRANKAGRLLPGWVRRNLRQLDEAAQMSENPKLARMMDTGALDRAYSTALDYLKTINPKERRKDWWLSLASSMAFNLLLLAAIILGLLRWQGMI